METAGTRATLGRIVGQAVTLSRVPLAKVAEQSGIPYSTLYRKIKGAGDFTVAELFSVAAVIGADALAWVAEAQHATASLKAVA